MSRENAHLVNAEGKINTAGKRYLALKREWLSHTRGHIDAQGENRFQGFYKTYNIEINSPTKKNNMTVVVDKGEVRLAINIDLWFLGLVWSLTSQESQSQQPTFIRNQ